MDAALKLTVKATKNTDIKGILAMLEHIKKDHPDLFQQAEMVVHIKA